MDAARVTPSPTPLISAELPALPAGVHFLTLDNGLVLILKEDHSAPVVSAQAWCKAGSIHEGKWLGAGLSHVLEHMLFKGTETRPGSRIDQEVQEAGGEMNAYTSFDRTVYWINVQASGTRTAVDVLCDIMQHATLPEAELARELDVIRREMDMGHDDPGRRSSRRLFETAYTRSPYRYTIIGYRDIFDRLTRADVLAYYREKYAPNNCFFVVVGDINPDEVAGWIRAAYATAKFQPLAPEVLPVEPRQMAERVVIEEAPIELGHVHLSWHIPDVRHPDVPILDVLAVLLGGGRSSRLVQEVREKAGLVHSVDAWTYNPGNPGLFGVSAALDGNQYEPALAAMLAEVQRLKEHPVSAAELTKAVKQFIAGTLASHKTMQGQAQDLGGSWLAAGDLNFSARYLEAVRRVTAADLMRVAREYLTTDNRTTYALLPHGHTPQAVRTTAASTDHPIQALALPNGLRLLLKEDHRLPFVEFRAVFRGGVLMETPANNGISTLMARMLLQGTTSRTARQIADEIESVGGGIDSFGGNHSVGVNLEVMRDDFHSGLTVLADVLRRPAFAAEALERERQLQLAAVRAKRDQLLQRCGLLARRALFGERGYGLDPLGNETALAGLSPTALAAHHAALLAPGNGVLAIFGDIDPERTRAAVEELFGDWPSIPSIQSHDHTAAPGPVQTSARVTETVEKKQAVLVLAYPDTTLASPDRPALELIQEACSDLGSRLFLRIRDELGLAYYVGAQNFLGLEPGWFSFYCGTAPEHAERVEHELRAEVAHLCAHGLSEAELQRAKAKLLGHRKIARQDLGSLAMSTALDELLGLGFDFADKEDAQVEAVTVADTRAAAQRYLDPAGGVLASVLPGGSR
jgi:zinc protease